MQITKGKRARAQRVVIYGPEGIGKSSLAAQFPEPVFIDTEGSTDNMDVARLDKPTSWTMMINQVAFIKANPTVCKTLVVDTIDWAESLALAHICAEHGKRGIEEFPWGSGYTYLIEEIGRFLNKLQELVELGINVVLTAHAQVKKFTKPDEMGSYDRYELKLSNKKTEANVSAKVKEWADMVLFIDYKTHVIIDEKTKKQKAQGGQRVMHTTHSPSWDAKNRHGLPDELPLDFGAIAHIFVPQQGHTPPAQSVPPTAMPTQAPVQQTATPSPVPTEAPVQGDLGLDMSTVNQTKPPVQPTPHHPSLPANLVQLMDGAQVKDEELQQVAYIRGHFPLGTPIENFPPDYWGMIVAHWSATMDVIQNQVRVNPELPFD